jgi:hypothetical protein
MKLALDDAAHRAQRICEQENANTVRGTEGTGEFERYTPPQYIELARNVLGGPSPPTSYCNLSSHAAVKALTAAVVPCTGKVRPLDGPSGTMNLPAFSVPLS